MASALHHNYAVVVHSSRAPSDAEWDAYLGKLGDWLPGLRGGLIVSDGGGPTSSQRRALKKKLLVEKTRYNASFALISPSMMARGIVLAINLFTPYIRAFRPEDIDQALTFLQVPTEERPSLLAMAKQLREQLDEA